MNIYLTLLLALIGILMNVLLAGKLLQPDWALALLLGALIAHRGYWVWVMPSVWIHDLIFYWSSFVVLPWMILAPLFITWCDTQVGASVWQRILAICVVVASLWFSGWSVAACILTILLSLSCWYVMVRRYVKPA